MNEYTTADDDDGCECASSSTEYLCEVPPPRNLLLPCEYLTSDIKAKAKAHRMRVTAMGIGNLPDVNTERVAYVVAFLCTV